MIRTKIILTAILAALLLAIGARADQDDYNSITQEPYGSKLTVKVWVDKGEGTSYEPGEDVRVYFKTNRDAYVVIYNIDTRGFVHLLYPYDYRDSRMVQGNRVYRVPDLRDDYYLRVNGPEGTERIVALASLEPINLPDLGWNVDPDQLTEEDFYYMQKPEGEDDWDFIERLNHRIVPGNVDYEIDAATFSVDVRYSRSYYVEPSFYFSYNRYPSWYDSRLYFGAVYFDYPFHAQIYIDGIFFGYAPLYLPRFLYGRHYVTVYHHGYLVYRDYCHVSPHQRLNVYIPRDRIYKPYVQRYAKDYKLIGNKPEIFWTKVQKLNTKYKATPVIKDNFTFKKNVQDRSNDKSHSSDKFKVTEKSQTKISKEKQFKERLPSKGGDKFTKLEGKSGQNLKVKNNSPAPKDPSQMKRGISQYDQDKFGPADNFKKSDGRPSEVSKEKQFKEKLQPTGGEKIHKTETPESRYKQEKGTAKYNREPVNYYGSKEKQAAKKEVQSQSGKESTFKQASRSKSPVESSQKIEKPKSVNKGKDSGGTSFRKETNFKSAPKTTGGNSGKSTQGTRKGKN